ncbi:MAG TPA: hypothetical protein VGM19_09355 [Armatimonadota bacterium]
MVELGTPEAFERLLAEVVGQGPAHDWCCWALWQADEQALPHVLMALKRHPNTVGLLQCLHAPLGEPARQAVIAVCRRTSSPSVVCLATTLMEKSAHDELRKVVGLFKKSASQAMRAACEIGMIAAHPHTLLRRLPKYLRPDMPAEVQDLALTVPGAFTLPEAQDCLRRRLSSGLVRDRREALRLIEDAQLEEFAPEVLRIWLEDVSPGARKAASKALGAVRAGLPQALANTLPAACERLTTSVLALVALSRSPEGATEGALSSQVQKVEEALAPLQRLRRIVTLTPDTDSLISLFDALRQTAGQLYPVCRYGAHLDTVAPLIESLLEQQVMMFRTFWNREQPEVRLYALQLAGRNTVAVTGQLPSLPCAGPPDDWDAIFTALTKQAESLAERSVSSERERIEAGDSVAIFPRFAGHGAWIEFQDLTHQAAAWGPSIQDDVLGALQTSLKNERVHRARANADLGEEGVRLAQGAYNDEPLLCLFADLSAVATVSREGSAGKGSVPSADPAMRDIFREQAIQAALLGILAQTPLPRQAAPWLIHCLASPNSLVAEGGERLLVALGEPALPLLICAVELMPECPALPRALEVCRCLDPRRVLHLARRHLSSKNPLLAAVSARILAQGSPKDAELLAERYPGAEELTAASLLAALAQLAPAAHLDLFVDALGSLYPSVRDAGWNALAAYPYEAVHTAAQRHEDDPNFYRRSAAREIIDEGEPMRIQRWLSARPAYLVAGEAGLGMRLASLGEGPFEWGISALLDEAEGIDLKPYEDLIAGDPELVNPWLEWSCSGHLTGNLLPRLRELATADDSPHREAARGALRAMLSEKLTLTAGQCLLYHGVRPDQVNEERLDAALQRALDRCTPDVVASLTTPNLSSNNPLGEALLTLDSDCASYRWGIAFDLLLREALPLFLSIAPLVLPAEDHREERLAAVQSEWTHLMQFQDVFYGFWVTPRLGLSDLRWYCRRVKANDSTKREMIDYLVALTTVVPAFPETRAEAQEVLLALFRPLLLKTLRALTASSTDHDDEQVMARLEDEFYRALGEYDLFWAEQPDVPLPFGTVLGMASPRPTTRAHSSGGGLPQKLIPFSHFLKRRMAELVTLKGALQTGRAPQECVTLDEKPDRDSDSPESAWTENQLIAAIYTGASADAIASVLEQPPAVLVQTFTIKVGGVPTQCVDLDGLVARLGEGVTAGAVQARDRRGQLPSVRHEGRRYFPLSRIPDIQALFTSDKALAQELQVDRHTLRRWRDQAPSGLSPSEDHQYLRETAAKLQAQRERSPSHKK